MEECKDMNKKKAQPFRVREIFPYAYHEAGHAVVGHVIGRLIEVVSIVPVEHKAIKATAAVLLSWRPPMIIFNGGKEVRTRRS
jgi:hypothetical protein